jgi:KDPG and KHG aldolase/Glucose-6-phosphate dehydrogenase, NAD binding domain
LYFKYLSAFLPSTRSLSTVGPVIVHRPTHLHEEHQLPIASAVDPCDFVIFGGTGDLAVRKLLPALYLRDRDGQLTADTRIIAVARDDEFTTRTPTGRDAVARRMGRHRARIVRQHACGRGAGGPVPTARFCPTGGITPTNMAEYLKTPNVGCVGDSWLTPADAVQGHDWQRISSLATVAAALVDPTMRRSLAS